MLKNSNVKGGKTILLFWNKKSFKVKSEGVHRGIFSERKGEVIPQTEGEDRTARTGTYSGKSGTTMVFENSVILILCSDFWESG